MSREQIETIKIEPTPDVRIRVISDEDTKAVKKNKKKTDASAPVFDSNYLVRHIFECLIVRNDNY